MRINAGIYKGRNIKMVGIDTTRETTDMVRQAIFNLLSFCDIKGIGLDLFSGSGAMGLEGLSRGLSFCYFNDINKIAYNTTKENIKTLKVEDKTKVFNLDYEVALGKIKEKLSYIFLDPPYHLDVLNKIIAHIDDNGLLEEDGFIIIETLKEYKIEPKNFSIYKEREYGIRKIVILEKKRVVD